MKLLFPQTEGSFLVPMDLLMNSPTMVILLMCLEMISNDFFLDDHNHYF